MATLVAILILLIFYFNRDGLISVFLLKADSINQMNEKVHHNDGFFKSFNDSTEYTKVIIGPRQTVVKTKIAKTPAELMSGLSGVTSLGEDEGLLFIGQGATLDGFWMKDMKIAIDIIWIDDNFKVTHVAEWVTPDSFPHVFYPPAPTPFVLEVNAGFAHRHKIVIGSSVQIF